MVKKAAIPVMGLILVSLAFSSCDLKGDMYLTVKYDNRQLDTGADGFVADLGTEFGVGLYDDFRYFYDATSAEPSVRLLLKPHSNNTYKWVIYYTAYGNYAGNNPYGDSYETFFSNHRYITGGYYYSGLDNLEYIDDWITQAGLTDFYHEFNYEFIPNSGTLFTRGADAEFEIQLGWTGVATPVAKGLQASDSRIVSESPAEIVMEASNSNGTLRVVSRKIAGKTGSEKSYTGFRH